MHAAQTAGGGGCWGSFACQQSLSGLLLGFQQGLIGLLWASQARAAEAKRAAASAIAACRDRLMGAEVAPWILRTRLR